MIFYTEKDAAKLIKKDFPELKIEEVSLLGQGWENAAFLINRKIVFRFPKMADASRKLELEMEVLPILKNYLNIKIPEFVFVGKCSLGKYVGYFLLPGSELKPVEKLSRKEFLNATESCAGLLTALKSFKEMDVLRKLDRWDTVVLSENYQRFFTTIEVEEKLTQLILKKLDAFLNTPSIYDEVKKEEVFLHGDLFKDHLLFDEAGRLASVIDFGDLAKGYSLVDLKGVYRAYGKFFLQSTLKCMNKILTDELAEHLDYLTFLDLLSAIEYGHIHNLPDLKSWGLNHLRGRFLLK